VIHLQPEPLFQTVIPSKLFEAMAMGVPVLHGVNGESAQLVEREGVGIVFRSGHASALVEAAIRLATDPGLCATCRRNAREAATRYDRRRLAQEMLQVLEAVVLGRQGTTQAHSTPDAAAP
jgi:glycosyltransferase involved in cell wall biosynthesis